MPAYEIESSAIWVDVQSVINSGSKPVQFEYRGQLHTELQDFNVMKIIAIDEVRDYANTVGVHLQIKFKIPLGDYMMDLYPYRDNLEFTIKRTQLQEGSSEKAPNVAPIVRRYKAVFLPDLNPVAAGSDLEQMDKSSLNNVEMVDCTLQLLDRSLEPLRVKYAPANAFRGVTQKQVLNNVLGGGSLKVLVDGKPSIDGIDIVEPDNTDTGNHIVIRDDVLLPSVPTYLQEKMGGVYSTGIGNFLQYYGDKHLWFVYPLFNTSRYDKAKSEKMIIYAIPQDKFPSMDRTYFKDAGVLKVIATANRKYQDSADVDFMNQGSGFRMADARAFMKKPAEMTDDGPKGIRTSLNHENAIVDRKDGLNFAPKVKGGPSSNPYIQYTRMTGMQVARVDLVWENTDPELLYPGMPVCYVFLDNNKPVELKGTLVFVHTLTQLQTTGINSNIYKNVTAMTLLVTQVTKEQKDKVRTASDPISLGTF